MLELRYNSKHLYFNLVVGLALFAYFTLNGIDSIAMLFAVSVGVLFLLPGMAPIFSNREIIIDKNKKELLFIVGAKRFYSKKKIIPFNKISHIEIRDRSLKNDNLVNDTIYLNLNGENKVKLEGSLSEDYSNIFTVKLSESIGGMIVCVR